ncbi:MAG: formylmethanofuran dehydrogenase subunit E family protein [Candidatus Thermoplasmatota archaeon]
MTPEEIAQRLEEFHGHLGPYVAVGYRMGEAARAVLGEGRLRARLFCGTRPPLSCMADGVQVSTSCTLGKGNIAVLSADMPSGEFHTPQRRAHIALRAEVHRRFLREMSKETERALAMEVLRMPLEALLEVRQE